MVNLFNDLLGIPFKLHGRDKTGYDCYGFVIELSKRLGHKLLDLDREYGSNNEQDLNNNISEVINQCHLVKSSDKHFGDILMFYDSKGRTCHIGIYLDHDKFIHCDAEGVHISKLETYFRTWENYTWQE